MTILRALHGTPITHAATVRARRCVRLDNSVLAGEVLRHGAYVCLRLSAGADARAAAGVALPALPEKLRLPNQFAAAAGPPSPVSDFCTEAARLLGPLARLRVIGGVVRPRTYTGAAMNNFAYANQVVQQPGRVMPNAFLVPMNKVAAWWAKDWVERRTAFLVPMNKVAAWWAKDWMERHTYFLPRYDDEGRMKSEGHALASAAGIPIMLRRTYKSTSEPAPEGAYDFVTYFECADADVPTFHQVCASLRDVNRNPEWKFVREGPTWHGRRVATWPDLFSSVR